MAIKILLKEKKFCFLDHASFSVSSKYRKYSFLGKTWREMAEHVPNIWKTKVHCDDTLKKKAKGEKLVLQTWKASPINHTTG